MNPKIRFKADNGLQFPDWEECQVNDITTICGGYAFSSEKMKDNPSMYQVIKMGNLYQGKLDLSRTPSYIESINEKEEEYLLKSGDIAITLTGTVNKHDYGYSYLFTKEKNLLLNQRLGLIRKKGSNDSRFILSVIKGNRFLKQFYSTATGGTGNQTNVSTKSIETIKIFVPHPDEQKKIANFLSDIDNMISIQEQQLAILEEQKKGVMQKIFSQEVRFKDDDGNGYPEWNEQDFYEVFTIKQNNTFSRDMLNYDKEGIQNIHYGDVLIKFGSFIDCEVDAIPNINNDISIDKYDMESYMQDGDIILADTAEDYTAGKVSEIYRIGNKKILSGLHTMLCRPQIKFASKYLGYYMNSEEYHKQIVRLLVGTKVYSINRNAIGKTHIKFPCESEQKKIADFLSNYDKTIEIKKKKIEAWENMREGLLQQMFV